jgi:pimeloyl-ACP methyl ester carboxylesterase
MRYEEISWSCDGHKISIGLGRAGTGPEVLLLPALSSISTRREMYPLQVQLAKSHSVISIDWPGFGDLPKPRIEWRPELYDRYLAYLLTSIIPKPFAIVAAGHAAGYVFRHFAHSNHAADRLVLLSPTWRGPLPTMMGGDRSIFPKIAKVFDPPVLGSMLYGLNVNRFVVGMMARGHVYADRAWLNEPRMENKLEVTKANGARHASARFVTGRLDPFNSRDEQMRTVQRIDTPMLNLYSGNAPRKSRMEMEALESLPNMKTTRLPQGKLSFYEEFPDTTFAAMREFLTPAPAT